MLGRYTMIVIFADYGDCERSIGGAPLFSLTGTNFHSPTQSRRPSKVGASVQSALYQVTAMLASIGIGRDVRKTPSRSKKRYVLILKF
jgi:hypothetical protein